MRGAPHNGFAWLRFRIKSRISAATFGLPGRRRDSRVQYHANARQRCQAITVSGRTMCRLRRQPGHRTRVASQGGSPAPSYLRIEEAMLLAVPAKEFGTIRDTFRPACQAKL